MPSSDDHLWDCKESHITKKLTLSVSEHLPSHIAKRAQTWIMKKERRDGSKFAISEVRWMAGKEVVPGSPERIHHSMK